MDATTGKLDIPQIDLAEDQTALIQTGMMMMWPTTTSPDGWVICDGTSYLRTALPQLFNLIGTTFGSVDGTHFNVPNLQSRFPVGLNAGDADFNVMGKVGGSKTHAHSLSDIGGAAIFISAVAAPNLFMRRVASSAWTANLQGDATSVASNTTAFSTAAGLVGSTDLATGVLPPYITLNFIIKT